MPTDALAVPRLTSVNSTTAVRRSARTIMVVNGSEDMIGLLEAVLEAGRYDVVFVESTEHAYSQVKRVQPNLIVLCTRIEDIGGFHVLSMLKLDEQTRGIPVLTYTTDYEGQEADEQGEDADAGSSDDDLLTVGRMN
jgi:CheY-like chemotaxis protein